ncbi:MAG: hypothetical protein EBS28_01940 [Chlamydiae bacterium]|nr:hypothetical protein [Chlamydiota bacterium]
MDEQKSQDTEALLDAVDILADVVDIDLSSDESVQKGEKTADALKEKFTVIHNYLKDVNKAKSVDQKLARGVQSIIQLASEAATKIDRILQQQGVKGERFSSSKEFTDLIGFYKETLKKRFEESLEKEESWYKEWVEEDFDPVDIQRKGLRDLEIVTKDKHYELFFLTKEDGTRFYNKSLLRHLRLVADFEALLLDQKEEDPIVRMERIKDSSIAKAARSIKKSTRTLFQKWLQLASKRDQERIVRLFYQAYIALTFAAEPIHLIEQGGKKSCLSYFSDFQNYIRELLFDMGYGKLVDNPPDPSDRFSLYFLELVHALCFAIFSQKFDHERAISYIYQLIGKELKKNRNTVDPSHLETYHEIMEIHEILGKELNKHPSGPLFKVIEIFQQLDEHTVFDPYSLRNIGHRFFDLNYLDKKASIYLQPCPTMQERIDQAQPIPEYEAFLRSTLNDKENVLWINLQDRTSLEEFARCRELEKISLSAEFQPILSLLTLPVSTPFYLQSEDYLKLSEKKQFKKVFLDQLLSGIQCGFYYPADLDVTKELFSSLIDAVEICNFKDKKELTRKNRLDWIETVYLLLILKAVEKTKPRHIVFISKDGVDVGAVTMAAFYALIKMLDSKSKWKEGEKELFISMHFLPALMERERIVDLHRLNRTISSISVLAANIEVKGGKFEGIETIFPSSFLKGLRLLTDE